MNRTSGRWARWKKNAGDLLDVHGGHACAVRLSAVERILQQGQHPRADAEIRAVRRFFVLGVVVAMLTTFYMFRLVFVAFWGGEKSEAAGHAHESPRIMVWPLRDAGDFQCHRRVHRLRPALRGGVRRTKRGPGGARRADIGTVQRVAGWGRCSELPRSGLGLCMAYGLIADAPPTRCRKDWAGFRAPCATGFILTNFTSVCSSPARRRRSEIADAFDRWIIYGSRCGLPPGSTDLCRPRLAPRPGPAACRFTPSRSLLGVAIVLVFRFGDN